ncbi:MAG: cupredoxin domain-containing protein [Chloroflexota bacterium]|nr:cupredoxin domain-containing protein [Chloroflexota bacterium]
MKTISFLLISILILQMAACNSQPIIIDVTLSDYKYTPNTFTVPAGKEITLNLKNKGFVSHMFSIFNLGTDVGERFSQEDEENIYWKVDVLPNKSVTANFTAPTEPGEYYVTCGLGGHHEAGMIGTLIVVGE